VTAYSLMFQRALGRPLQIKTHWRGGNGRAQHVLLQLWAWRAAVGIGRVIVSEIEAPIILVNLV
jgi:hypothetical protein